MSMFIEPGAKTLIEWASVSIETSKEWVEKKDDRQAACHLKCAVSYIKDAINKLEKKGI